MSEDVLRNIELSELPLANIALKTSRLARLLNDFDNQKIMAYEASGYPSTPDGVHPDIYQLAVMAGREYQLKDEKSGSESGLFGSCLYLATLGYIPIESHGHFF